MTYQYIIESVPPTYNKYMGNSNDFNKYRKKKEEWEWLILAAVGKNKPRKPIEYCIIEIEYNFKDKRRRDPDNYSGKFIMDGLKKAGVIKDDSFRNINYLLIRGKDGCGKNLTKVRIMEI